MNTYRGPFGRHRTAVTERDEEWQDRAGCKGTDVEVFYDPVTSVEALRICRHCPVRRECLVEALQRQEGWGVWGGKTDRQRRWLEVRDGRIVKRDRGSKCRQCGKSLADAHGNRQYCSQACKKRAVRRTTS